MCFHLCRCCPEIFQEWLELQVLRIRSMSLRLLPGFGSFYLFLQLHPSALFGSAPAAQVFVDVVLAVVPLEFVLATPEAELAHGYYETKPQRLMQMYNPRAFSGLNRDSYSCPSLSIDLRCAWAVVLSECSGRLEGPNLAKVTGQSTSFGICQK